MRILLIDGYNIFIRNFTANTSLNYRGDHIGGIIGSLMQIRNSSEILAVDRIVVVFDGQNGSKKRKKIYSQYKQNRGKNPIKFKLPHGIQHSNVDYDKLRLKETIQFIQCLELLPITCIIINQSQADDIIAYLSLFMSSNNNNIFIMSNDKDFYQLLNTNIKI